MRNPLEYQSVIRMATVADAAAVNRIYIETVGDMLPGNPDVVEAQTMLACLDGDVQWRKHIEAAQNDPFSSSVSVAILGETVVGFCYAEAPPDSDHTLWRGIAVMPKHQREGIGQRLEMARQGWARAIGRSIRVQIDERNKRSINFFQKQGFTNVDILEATEDIPFRSIVMELSHFDQWK